MLPSLALHGLLLIALTLATIGHPITLPPVRSIEVEIIDQQEFEDSFEVPPDVAVTPLAVPDRTVEPEAVPPAPTDGMTQATDFFAGRVLADPQNAQVKKALPTLETTERVIQVCNIEGLEQLARARPGTLPDSISPSAFKGVEVKGYTLEAPQAAYRAARSWFAFRFSCTVKQDFTGVTAYSFAIGVPIPRDQWDAHDLIAEDEDE